MTQSNKEMAVKTTCLALVVAIIFSSCIFQWITIDHITITVDNRERIVTGYGKMMDSKYLVFTEGEVFENVDSWAFFKFSSSDTYSKLKKGNTYRAKVSGWRIPFLSMYRNIIVVKLQPRQ